MKSIESVGCVEEFDILAYVTLAEALLANDELEAAKGALRVGRGRFQTRLDHIQDPALRASFLERIPDHTRLCELCRSLGE